MDSPVRSQWTGSAGWSSLILVSIYVLGIYFTRLDLIPICGEEPRWACGAIQMLETGDWIVPRQQGQVFPERPPFSSWAMAAVACLRGEMDAFAIRLPSVLAVWLTSLVVAIYAGQFLSRIGALASGLIYATFGQVMQIGRMGESEAVFTCFLGSALLVWHALYVARRPAWCVWSIGYALAALAALVKGIQAPIYFGVATWGFIVYQRDWRMLVGWAHALGAVVFLVIVGSWQVPFYWATDWKSVMDIWWGLAGDRLTRAGFLAHFVSYPIETWICLLPSSCLFVLLFVEDVRQELWKRRSLVAFLVIAVALTYPSVWFAAMARGRYFMPLYPLIAVFLGAIVEIATSTELTSRAGAGWTRYLRFGACATWLIAGVIVLAYFAPKAILAPISQSFSFTLTFVAVTVPLAGWLWALSTRTAEQRSTWALLTFCGLTGFIQVALFFNVFSQNWNDPRAAMADARSRIAEPKALVSFGAADHRFVYFYGMTIPELPWPESADAIPPDVTYFCFDVHACDTPQLRVEGRGRSWKNTPGSLPFQWEQVAIVNCERRVVSNPWVVTVIGKITDPKLLASRHNAPDPRDSPLIVSETGDGILAR